MQQDIIEIINPVAQREDRGKKGKLAPRYPELKGKVIGLLANPKPNADKFLEILSGLLKERQQTCEVIFKRKTTWTGADCLPELIEKCNVIVTAFAD